MPVQSSPVQSSPVQSSPVQSSPVITDSRNRTPAFLFTVHLHSLDNRSCKPSILVSGGVNYGFLACQLNNGKKKPVYLAIATHENIYLEAQLELVFFCLRIFLTCMWLQTLFGSLGRKKEITYQILTIP